MADGEFSQDQCKQLAQEMLDKLVEVLDEHVVFKLIKEVPGITISEKAEVLSIDENPQDVIQRLMDKFLSLSNEVVVKTLQPLLTQCPWIKIPMLNK